MKYPLFFGAFAAISAALLTLDSRALASQAAPQIEFPQASPAATVKQRVGFTDISVEYSRPSVRDRKIFGGLVPFGEVWRTGANAATKITFSTDVNFGGQYVAAGSYALFTIPTESSWTVILNKVTGQWGAYAYDEKNDVVRVTVKPVALPELVETMSIVVMNVRDESALIAIDWEKTRVPIPLETDVVGVIQPQIEAAMAGAGKKPYFQAAMFYYEHNLDLKKAAAWIDEAIKEQPDALWILYRKGLILAKAGDKPGAKAAAQKALDLATKDATPVGKEYKRLSETLLASLK
jgi:tetratricopeptide (TPR) repeat protein